MTLDLDMKKIFDDLYNPEDLVLIPTETELCKREYEKGGEIMGSSISGFPLTPPVSDKKRGEERKIEPTPGYVEIRKRYNL